MSDLGIDNAVKGFDVDSRPGKKSRKVRKLVEVWYRASNRRKSLLFRDWVRFGRYKDTATAQQVVDQKRTDPYFEYEVRS